MAIALAISALLFNPVLAGCQGVVRINKVEGTYKIPSTSKPPTIDGKISEGEWSGARLIDGNAYAGIYAMHDGWNLYLLAKAKKMKIGLSGLINDKPDVCSAYQLYPDGNIIKNKDCYIGPAAGYYTKSGDKAKIVEVEVPLQTVVKTSRRIINFICSWIYQFLKKTENT